MPYSRLNWPVTLQDKLEWRLHRSTIGVKSSECSSMANSSSLTLQDCSLLQQSVIKQMLLQLEELVLPCLLCVCVSVLPAKYSASGADMLRLGAKTSRGLGEFVPPARYSSQVLKLYDNSGSPAAEPPSNLGGALLSLEETQFLQPDDCEKKGCFSLRHKQDRQLPSSMTSISKGCIKHWASFHHQGISKKLWTHLEAFSSIKPPRMFPSSISCCYHKIF